MRLRISAIGRMKSGPETDLFDRYLDRARAAGRSLGIGDIAVRELAESRAASADRRREDEAGLLLGSVGADACLVALDEHGRDQPSAGLASFIGDRLADGTAEIAFLIGGPDGHGSAVRRQAALVIAFGRATWPHRLVRVMLAEQLYRATTILTGHPYHRE